MSHEDGRDRDAIAGLPLDAAVEQVLDGNPSLEGGKTISKNDIYQLEGHKSSSETDAPDPETVRATLDRVTTDGVVRRDAVEDALSETAKVVSTAETRTELAGIELSDTREAAESVSDLDAVATRVGAFESRLDDVRTRVTDLGSDLETLVERATETGRIYEVAAGMRRLTADAKAVQRDADELALDLESFQRWVANPDVRFRELAEDVDAVQDSVEDLAGVADEIAAATGQTATAIVAETEASEAKGGETEEDEAQGVTTTVDSPGESADADRLGVALADARLRRRVTVLLVADLRSELADLRTWAEREGEDLARADELGDRLDDLDACLSSVGDRLAALADPEWTDRFGDQLAAFETATDDLEPPLDWSAVEAAFEEHRPEVGD